MKSVHTPVLALGVALMAASGASAQPVLVAGWDFSHYIGGSSNTQDYETYFGQWGANYSDLIPGGLPSPHYTEAPAFGTVIYDGTSGSNLIGTLGSFVESIIPSDGFLSSNAIQAVDGFPFNDVASMAQLEFTGQPFKSPLTLALTADGSAVVFKADLTSIGEQGSGWILRFAAVELEDGANLAVDASTDGSAWTALDPITVSTVDTGYAAPAPVAFDGASTVYFRLTASNVEQELRLDNVGISAVIGAVETSFWSASTAGSTGWRYSGEGYDEPGIGWIWDLQWPWVYTTGLGDGSTGEWIYVHPEFGDRNGFYAYVHDGGYWIYGVSAYGFYYSFESGSEGWALFTR